MERNKKIKKVNLNEMGITLVALVVTIIVLLILAGVTISLVLGDNGVIGRAQYASICGQMLQRMSIKHYRK